MADADPAANEDANPNTLSQRSAAAAAASADVDLSDETQDFRFLSLLSKSEAPGIPRRGEKDFEHDATALQSDTLAASREAMRAALSQQRVHVPKARALAVYDRETNGAVVRLGAKGVGTHLLSMGRAVRGKEGTWLGPEEALWLLERGSLEVVWPEVEEEGEDGSAGEEEEEEEEEGDEDFGAERKVENGAHDEAVVKHRARRRGKRRPVPMSLQAGYATFIGLESAFGGHLTLERYVVYSTLRRSGYIVLRGSGWDGSLVPAPGPEVSLPNSGALGPFSQLWKFLAESRAATESASVTYGPLVGKGLYRSYADIYRRLQLISYHDPSKPSSLPPPADPLTPTFHVYKPTSGFKKSSPGPPDFIISVIDARSMRNIPSLHQLDALLNCTPYSPLQYSSLPFPRSKGPQKSKVKSHSTSSPAELHSSTAPPAGLITTFFLNMSRSVRGTIPSIFPFNLFSRTPDPRTRAYGSAGPKALYNRLKHGHRRVLLAVVDGGVTSFVQVSECGFGGERLWDGGKVGRAPWENVGKKGGGSRGGRGGGRGRGK